MLGHAIEGMPQHYATATIARLVGLANKVTETRDHVTLLRVINGQPSKVTQKSRKKKNGLNVETSKPLIYIGKFGAAGRIRTHDPLVRSYHAARK